MGAVMWSKRSAEKTQHHRLEIRLREKRLLLTAACLWMQRWRVEAEQPARSSEEQLQQLEHISWKAGGTWLDGPTYS